MLLFLGLFMLLLSRMLTAADAASTQFAVKFLATAVFATMFGMYSSTSVGGTASNPNPNPNPDPNPNPNLSPIPTPTPTLTPYPTLTLTLTPNPTPRWAARAWSWPTWRSVSSR